MTHNTPLSPRPLSHLKDMQLRVLNTAQLRAHGVGAAEAAEQCRAGGPWQQLLPGVFLLHPGPPTSDERLHAALLYAVRSTPGARGAAVPAQSVAERPSAARDAQRGASEPRDPYPEAMITGLAALTLHGFLCAPPLLSLNRIDVLVPCARRVRSTGYVRILRTDHVPRPARATGLPVAPVPRALADAVADLEDTASARRMLTEAVRAGHCDPAAVVGELDRARLLTRPHVVDAVESLLAEGRALAENLLYRMVRDYGLEDPLWNVDLRLPDGPFLGGVDAYWPAEGVALELDTRAPRPGHDARGDEALWAEYARKREDLERLGITVIHVSPRKLRESLVQQAVVVRTALIASRGGEPITYVEVLPR